MARFNASDFMAPLLSRSAGIPPPRVGVAIQREAASWASCRSALARRPMTREVADHAGSGAVFSAVPAAACRATEPEGKREPELRRGPYASSAEGHEISVNPPRAHHSRLAANLRGNAIARSHARENVPVVPGGFEWRRSRSVIHLSPCGQKLSTCASTPSIDHWNCPSRSDMCTQTRAWHGRR